MASTGTPSQVDRAGLQAFHGNEITPDSMTVYMIGDIGLDEAKDAVNKAFGRWSAKADSALQPVGEAQEPRRRVILVDYPGAASSTIVAGHAVTPYDASTWTEISIMNAVFGGSFESRLNMNLRENKGWSYGYRSGISLNTKYYDGPKADSWALVFDPPEELVGRINMVSEMGDVINAGLFYLGMPKCNGNKDDLKKLNALLVESKKKWRTIDYGVIEKLTSEDVYASHNWNGASMRARLQVPTIKYVYPKEGLVGWADNVVLLEGAKNVEEAKTFMNYIMAPENAAMISNFARYANGIAGSEEFMDPEMAKAPEIIGYEGAGKPEFIPPCPQEVQEMYTKIWNNLLK